MGDHRLYFNNPGDNLGGCAFEVSSFLTRLGGEQ